MTVATEAFIILGIILAVAGVYALWRTRRIRRGVIWRSWLIILLSLGYIATFLFIGGMLSGALPDWAVALDVVVAVAVAIPTAWFVAKSSVFHQREDGRWMFQGRVVVLVLWFLLFAGRLILEVAVLNKVYFLWFLNSVNPLNGVQELDVVVIAVVDAVLAASTGLLFGGNVGLYSAYLRARREASHRPPASPHAELSA